MAWSSVSEKNFNLWCKNFWHLLKLKGGSYFFLKKLQNSIKLSQVFTCQNEKVKSENTWFPSFFLFPAPLPLIASTWLN